jgi:type IV secretory pathway protease TraF
MVAAWLPPSARSLAAKRGYLPRGIPAVKRIVAASGDRICANRSMVLVNGLAMGRRLALDPHGRAMPRWTGCRRLRDGEYLLMTDNPLSFDGRYFGLTHEEELIGRATLIWRR